MPKSLEGGSGSADSTYEGAKTLIDVAIIGAGPYGLSLAAHLQAVGVDFRIFGRTMEAWKHKMPAGMFLKSQPWASCLFHPDGKMTLEEFCRQQGVDYHPMWMEPPLELFCSYGEAFRESLGLQVADKKAVNIAAVPDGFRVAFDDGEVVSARKVVLAVGVHAFSHVPDVLAALPPDLVSHSADYGPMDRLHGRSVVVVGSGASAINLAVLLHERGVSTTLLARDTKLGFVAVPRTGTSRLRQMASGVGLGWLLTALRVGIAGPESGIGGGWDLWFYATAPGLVHKLPSALRRHIVRNALGPLGGYSMKARMVGKVPVELGWKLTDAEAVEGRVQLRVSNRSGAERMVSADHVVAATGYRVDLQRLSFLDPGLQQRIRTAGAGAPVLSKEYETSVSGLHVIGPASADSFGPVARFVYGAQYPARRLARLFAADASHRPEGVQLERSLAVEGI